MTRLNSRMIAYWKIHREMVRNVLYQIYIDLITWSLSLQNDMINGSGIILVGRVLASRNHKGLSNNLSKDYE